MKQRALSIAIAVAMLSIGLTAALPAQAADPQRCDGDYTLASSLTLASKRTLDPSETEIGEITLSSSDSDRTLHVDLLTDNRQLDFHVFKENGDCEDYADEDSHCEGTISDKDADTNTDCVMVAPSSGSITYNVNFWNNGTQALDYKAAAK